MAEDYGVASFALVDPRNGFLDVQNVPTTIGSADTDDGTWDIGDRYRDGSTNRLFDGFYEDGDGNLFLVFTNSSGDVTAMVSPNSTHSYPTRVDDIPPYSSSQLSVCFAAGTLIDVPDGVRQVEELCIGDEVTALDGRTVLVKWIGRQRVLTSFGPAERLRPVRIKAGALDAGVPRNDLTLTADHALLIDGLLINAGALVNGSGIDYVPLQELGDCYTVYHIETENHDVILAEGAPAETYIDYVSRRAFDNYDEYVELYGEDRTIPEMAVTRISSVRLVPEAIARKLGLVRTYGPKSA